MARITCPNCGEVINVDPTKVEDLTRQLRDELFTRDLEARLAEMGHVHDAQLNAMRVEERRKADQRVSDAERKADQRIHEAEHKAADLRSQVATLEAKLSAQEGTLRAQSQAELLKATADLERSRGELETKLQVEQANAEQVQANLRAEMARREGELNKRAEERLRAKDAQIEQYKGEIERLRDYRIRLSTKLIGESLERHCEEEFNRIRMQAYPRATFEKDNQAIGGTKGDFIFRDYDEDGNELLSIMFEMKNEEELSTQVSRKRNEDHLKKLDADRTKKGCEYAVLVSTLEPDNDFYNAGIADVSWRYPKMFVVRPQCFITIIGLLKAAALSAHPYRMQLERARREELDVSTFEDKVAKIMGSIENDYTRAAKNYERAEADIDAIIKKLEDLKKQLKTATTWFEAAQKQGDRLTVKRLTRGNQTMKAAFAEVAAAREEAALEAEGDAEPTDSPDGLDPDALE